MKTRKFPPEHNVLRDVEQPVIDPKNCLENSVSMKELLELLKNNYRKRTVYSWIQQGMPHIKLGGKLWFNKATTLAWLVEKGDNL